MSAMFTRLHSGRHITWRTLIGLVLVPVTAAGVLLWGLWSPNERLDTISAAVVNLDEPVTVDGQLVPMGRVLAGELIGGGSDGTTDNFDWQLTDEADAGDGLESGRYAAVITIPKNFSESATSAADGAAAATATIDVQTSDRGRLLDSALVSIVTTTATELVNRTLSEQTVGQLLASMGELGAGMEEAAGGATQLAEGLDQLAAGARSAAAGGSELATGMKSYVSGVNDAVTQLQQGGLAAVGPLQAFRTAVANGEVSSISDPAAIAGTVAGLDQLIAGLQLAGSDSPESELNKLKAAGDQLAAGARASADGQRQLASGIGQSADGAVDLADGLDSAAAQVPRYSEAEQDRLAQVMVTPVEARGGGDELFSAAGVPLFAGIALWAGALAVFLVLAPLWRRTREAARGVGYITMRSAWPAIAVGAAQGLIAGLVLPPLLGYDLAQGAVFCGLSLVAGVAFALVNQGLSALLGGLGRFVSFVLLVVTFAVGVVSTAPSLLQAIGDASPLGVLLEGFQAVAMGTSGVGSAFALLVLWGSGGLALTAWAVARARRRPALPT